MSQYTVGKTDMIWLCHSKWYVKQTGSDYVMIKGMENRQDVVMSCQTICKTGRMWLCHNKRYIQQT
jgi:hypothetical protein